MNFGTNANLWMNAWKWQIFLNILLKPLFGQKMFYIFVSQPFLIHMDIPGAIFTTLHCLCNLQMDPFSLSVTLIKGGEKLSSLLGTFISYKENEKLWMRHLHIMSSNGTAHFEKFKQLLEYQNYILLKYIWWSES